MIDMFAESMLTIKEATAILPGRPSIATVWRWMSKGCGGVKLEYLVVGRTRYTSREALQRFAERRTLATGAQPSPMRTPAQRRRAIEQAEAELARAGI